VSDGGKGSIGRLKRFKWSRGKNHTGAGGRQGQKNWRVSGTRMHLDVEGEWSLGVRHPKKITGCNAFPGRRVGSY